MWQPRILGRRGGDDPVDRDLTPNLVHGEGPQYHLRLVEASRTLAADGVLVLGSGAMTHNLAELDWSGGVPDTQVPPWVSGFTDWFGACIAAGDRERLAGYRSEAPHAARNHPSEEHLLPLFVALGASARGRGRRLHASVQMRAMAMDVYRFD